MSAISQLPGLPLQTLSAHEASAEAFRWVNQSKRSYAEAGQYLADIVAAGAPDEACHAVYSVLGNAVRHGQITDNPLDY